MSRVRTIWVAYCKCSIWASVGNSWLLTKKTKSRRGRNWTVLILKGPVHLVYLHDLRQRYNTS